MPESRKQIPRDCPYCSDASCTLCVEHQSALDKGRWPQHTDGSPYPWPGYMNITTWLSDQIKKHTAGNCTFMLVIQGDHPDDFAAIGSSTMRSDAPARTLYVDMGLRAAQSFNDHVAEHDSYNFRDDGPTMTVKAWRDAHSS